MRPLVLVLALLGTAPLLSSCSGKSEGLDLAADCKARMREADPSGSVGRMEADVRSSISRSDVYVTGTVPGRAGAMLDHFHCVYNGDALVSDDRKPAPPPAAPNAAGGAPDDAAGSAPAAARPSAPAEGDPLAP